MASKQYYRDNLGSSGEVYEVFREITSSEDGDYKSNIADSLEKGQNINRIVDALFREDIIKKGKRTRAQYYEINKESLENLLNRFFESENSFPSDFLYRYVHAYVHVNKHSTIRRMLRDDFVTIFAAYQDVDQIPDYLEEFFDNKEVKLYDKRIFDVARHSFGEESVFVDINDNKK